jgi:hypothetical protein
MPGNIFVSWFVDGKFLAALGSEVTSCCFIPGPQPALAESSTMTALRSEWRVQLAKTSRSATSAAESIFARFPGMSQHLRRTRNNIQQQLHSNNEDNDFHMPNND